MGQCHTVEKGGDSKHGPPLWGIMGRLSGTADGWNYSEANKHSYILWSEKHMFKYLIDPKKYIPGTTMAYGGMRKAAHPARRQPWPSSSAPGGEAQRWMVFAHMIRTLLAREVVCVRPCVDGRFCFDTLHV